MENKELKQSNRPISVFFSGVVILTVANLLVKSVGLISKICLNRVVGSIGAGYYSSAYEIYAYLYVISTAGLPVALSIMVSRARAKGRYAEAKKIFNLSIVLFMIVGFVFALLMVLFSKNIANFLESPETSLCIIAIAPTILFVCLSSCMRGYFQGYQLMAPTAVSQFIEALCKVGVGVTLAIWARNQGFSDEIVSAYTILGVTVGVLLGMAYLYVRKLFFKDEQYHFASDILEDTTVSSNKELLKELFGIAIPITVSSSVLSLTTILDTMMVQRRLLDFGMEQNLVKIQYGDYTSLVISLFNLPTILMYPIANALVPLISATRERGEENQAKKIRAFSIRIIMLIAFPCAVGLSFFSKQILSLLQFRPDSVERATPWLSVAAISVIFLGLIAGTNAFLNTSGRQKYPIISMAVGALVKLIANYILLKEIGIYGAPISTVLCYLVAGICNVFFTVKYVGALPDIKKTFVFPFALSLLTIGAFFGINQVLSPYILPNILTILCIFGSAVLYLVVIIKIKLISQEEILLLPKGEKIVKILEKCKIL